MISLFGKVKFSDLDQKPWFIFGSRKKVVSKGCHYKEDEERNRMALVSVA